MGKYLSERATVDEVWFLRAFLFAFVFFSVLI